MIKLTNTKSDKIKLSESLDSGIKPRAIIEVGYFENAFANSLKTKEFQGTIIGMDIESGYCKWENIQGNKMPVVCINSITLNTASI